MIEISPEFLRENPQVSMEVGTQFVAVAAGRHFGSKFPGDPAKLAVYDFLPDVLLRQVNNLGDFRGCLVFDKWVGNADARQSIFFRARLREWGPAPAIHPLKLGFMALMIDHGNGISTRYGHLSGYAVTAGQAVHRGDVGDAVEQAGRANLSSHTGAKVCDEQSQADNFEQRRPGQRSGVNVGSILIRKWPRCRPYELCDINFRGGEQGDHQAGPDGG